MKPKNTFYVTTPIYYPSGKPHIGSAYTTLAADILSRYHKLLGEEVFFLTGTDEHTKKVIKVAEKEGKSPKEYLDSITPIFKESWKKLNIQYNRFIRTSDRDHEEFVKKILKEVYEKGDIYKGFYDGLYCFDCEAYYTEKDCPNKICPIHKKQLDNFKEETYFFKLSKYRDDLLNLYKKNPEFIAPRHRKSEIINRVKEGLRDISISRKNEGWGIELPFDKSHVAFVWFDALTNYVSGIGIIKNKKLFKKFWPSNVHLVGKDILWFHTVIWPAMLFAAKIKQPKKVFAHGWWLTKDTKIGKSSGNATDLNYLIGTYGADSIRYFLFRETPFGEDGDFSEEKLVDRHNNELANKLGNLVSRVSALAEKYGIEKTSLSLDSKETQNKVFEYLQNYEIDKALNEIFTFIDRTNEYIQNNKPWETGNKKVLYELCNAIKDIAILLSPFIPETSEKIAKIFNFEISLKSLNSNIKITKIKKAPILFNKIETVKENMAKTNVKQPVKSASIQIPTKELPPEPPTVNHTPKISFEEFQKIELKVGKILSVKEHPKADKLYVLEVDFGNEKRTIVAGLRNHYEKEHLQGKKAIFVTNLAPANLRGIESNGMILVAVNEDEDEVVVLTPDKDIEEGSKIR